MRVDPQSLKTRKADLFQRISQDIASARAGRMHPEDQAYMARAILQLSDEVAKLRQMLLALKENRP